MADQFAKLESQDLEPACGISMRFAKKQVRDWGDGKPPIQGNSANKTKELLKLSRNQL
jgi:hypothetical protein